MSIQPGNAIDEQSTTALREAMEPGERLLWSGRPRRGLMLRAGDAFLIPFSLLWCGFVIFWEWSVVSIGHASWLLELWGVPFIAVGLHFVLGRFLVDAYQRRRTFYGVTDSRVLIAIDGFRRSTRTLSLEGLTEIKSCRRARRARNTDFWSRCRPLWRVPTARVARQWRLRPAVRGHRECG
jgi:hypothetical protein